MHEFLYAVAVVSIVFLIVTVCMAVIIVTIETIIGAPLGYWPGKISALFSKNNHNSNPNSQI